MLKYKILWSFYKIEIKIIKKKKKFKIDKSNYFDIKIENKQI